MQPGGGQQLGRIGFESGIRGEYLSRDLRTRYRYHGLAGEIMILPLSIDAVLFKTDSSHHSSRPLLRLTTFWPSPNRHDVYLDIGWWAEVLRIEHRPRNSEDDTVLRTAGSGLTLDLWHTPDMNSYIRIRSGATGDVLMSRATDTARFALTPLAYLEGDITFDRDGFHRLTFQSGWEGPIVFEPADKTSVRLRFVNELSYEVIVLAINDQPISTRSRLRC